MTHGMTRSRRKRGQSATEYLLTVAVLAIAAAAITYDPIRESMESASERLSNKVEKASNQGGYGMDGCGSCQR